jgi:hypothetical protein
MQTSEIDLATKITFSEALRLQEDASGVKEEYYLLCIKECPVRLLCQLGISAEQFYTLSKNALLVCLDSSTFLTHLFRNALLYCLAS